MLNNLANKSCDQFLEGLSYKEDTNYSSYKLTKALTEPKQPVPPLLTTKGWAREFTEKANAFADHLQQVFTSPPSNDMHSEIEDSLLDPLPPTPALKPTSPAEVSTLISTFKENKVPGLDKLTAKILKELLLNI